MKKIILSVAFLVIAFTTVFAQDQKEDLVDKVANKHYWVPSAMVDSFVTVNVSPEIWNKMFAEVSRPVGVTSFANLGMGISDFLDNTASTSINKLCGFSIEDNKRRSNLPLCKDQIAESKGKIRVTVNGTNIRLTEDSYMLLMKAIGTVRGFLAQTKGVPGVREGWKPKAKSISIIINTGKTEKDLGAKWNADFTEAVITTSPYIEVPGWSDKILAVLKKGVNNY